MAKTNGKTATISPHKFKCCKTEIIELTTLNNKKQNERDH